MNTATKKYAEKIFDEYLRKYDVYSNHNLGYNIRDVVKYAREKGCALVELTPVELALFATNK